MNDQAANLRRQLKTRKHGDQAKTISIVSGKGGVGKSNFALNFSLELTKKQKKVLLLMGNIDVLLGLQAEQSITDMLNDFLPIQQIIQKGPCHLDFISRGSGLIDFFALTPKKKAYFMEQYNKLTKVYDYIIFDMAEGASRDDIFFVLSSDECIVITAPESTSLTDAYSMIKYIVNKQRNMPIYVVMNRCHTERSGIHYADKFQQIVARFLHVKIEIMGFLSEDKNVSHAVTGQTPYVLLNDKSSISRSLKEITSNYLSYL